ncbi:hypothetical protein Leryth_013994 [Lithospermum erythrorhizon]|nr:hypothetical protein Leryth_013994 [Lithospermum erythrorhizon]
MDQLEEGTIYVQIGKWAHAQVVATCTFEDLHIIHELDSNHDTSDEQTMNIERIDGQSRLALSEPVKIDICNNEARWTTICILEYPFKIVLN